MEIQIGGAIAPRALRHDIQPQTITEEPDIRRIQELAALYDLTCEARPLVNRIVLVRNLGIRIFNLDFTSFMQPVRLWAGRPCRAHETPRHYLMAFAYVVGDGKHHFITIGQHFNRSHASVMHAVHKYQDSMRELLR